MTEQSITVTTAVGAWLGSLVAWLRNVAASNRPAKAEPLPDLFVSLVAGLKGQRVRLRNKETGEPLPTLRLPSYLIGPLSSELQTALGFNAKGEPINGAKRYIKSAPRYTLDGTFRGLIDMAFGRDLPRDGKRSKAVSETLYTLTAGLVAGTLVPPRVSWSGADATLKATWQARPEGRTDADRILGLAEPYTLSPEGRASFESFFKAYGPFPLSGLGAFDNGPKPDPKGYCIAYLDGETAPLTLANGKVAPFRVPSFIMERIKVVVASGKAFTVRVEPYTPPIEPPAATLDNAPNIMERIKASLATTATAPVGRKPKHRSKRQPAATVAPVVPESVPDSPAGIIETAPTVEPSTANA